MTHGYRDPETKLYWNNYTMKWLKKPVRNSTKGQAVGKSKGLSIGKNRGKSYLDKLGKIKTDYPTTWKSYAWLPINITVQDIENAALLHWNDSKTKFEIDRALSLSSLLIIMRCKVDEMQKRKHVYSEGYVNLHSKDLKHFVGANYKKYIRFFKAARFIRSYSSSLEQEKETFCPSAFAKLYKWHNRHLTKIGDLRMYQRIDYNSPRVLVKLFHKKEARRQQTLKHANRQSMVEHVYTVAANIDVDGFTNWALANPDAFINSEELNHAIVVTNAIKTGELHITPNDTYGERFHSIFTNTSRHLRKFIMIDGGLAKELDIKASQFFFFACLVHFPEQCLGILKDRMQQVKIREVLHLMKHYYDSYEDVREFVDASLSNSIYETISLRYNKLYSRKVIKDYCFRAFFSRSGQSKEAKSVLKVHYKNVVRLCEILNNRAKKLERQNTLAGTLSAPIYSIPQLLQRLESRVMIDVVAMRATSANNADKAQHEFVSVHDSFIIASEDEPSFRNLINKSFTEHRLPSPAVECK